MGVPLPFSKNISTISFHLAKLPLGNFTPSCDNMIGDGGLEKSRTSKITNSGIITTVATAANVIIIAVGFLMIKDHNPTRAMPPNMLFTKTRSRHLQGLIHI